MNCLFFLEYSLLQLSIFYIILRVNKFQCFENQAVRPIVLGEFFICYNLIYIFSHTLSVIQKQGGELRVLGENYQLEKTFILKWRCGKTYEQNGSFFVM